MAHTFNPHTFLIILSIPESNTIFWNFNSGLRQNLLFLGPRSISFGQLIWFRIPSDFSSSKNPDKSALHVTVVNWLRCYLEETFVTLKFSTNDPSVRLKVIHFKISHFFGVQADAKIHPDKVCDIPYVTYGMSVVHVWITLGGGGVPSLITVWPWTHSALTLSFRKPGNFNKC